MINTTSKIIVLSIIFFIHSNCMAAENLKVLEVAMGDLDKDKVDEKVVVYDTGRVVQFGTERELHIYKLVEDRWKLWKKSVGPVLPSEHGGAIGDPFQGVRVERGSVVIFHYGGSRSKWSYTHRYRYQNGEWYLIGATMISFIVGDYFETFDYNLSTGDILYQKSDDSFEEKIKFEKIEKRLNLKLNALPKMDGFYPGDNKLDIIGTDETIYY